MFGVVPNYSTVERNETVKPMDAKTAFRLTALGSFDPYVYPFVAFTAGLAELRQGSSNSQSYEKQYATSFADNTLGNFMTSAIMPTLLKQDPRYFVLGEGTIFHRAMYALSRSAVTRNRSGQRQFNASEIAGNGIGAGLSNAYHPSEDRTMSGTMYRWGTQILWDTLTNEAKEFWPDIRQHIHKH
jgi:hypothetical protein